MDVITMARELGKMIQQDQRFKDLEAARAINDSDMELQNLIGEFNLKKIALNREVSKADKDNEKIAQLDKEMRECYQAIMQDENMIAYNQAKAEVDEMMRQINAILSLSLNGQDPDTAEIPSACSGSCGSCSGCH